MRKICSSARKNVLLIVLAGLMFLTSGQLASGRSRAAEDDAALAADAQRVVDGLRRRLGITAAVSVRVVEWDARVVSVRAQRDGGGGFALSVQREFLSSLSAAQRQAALAHELGHVWIATHHPFLQTEQLANRVAMRVVAREQLIEVYQRLWGPAALHGGLDTFLGVEATAAPEQQ